MKKIKTTTTQKIYLETFGFIEISESLDGAWDIDLFPRHSDNVRKNIRIDTTFNSLGDKYFETPKENKNRIDDIYNNQQLTK